MGKLMPLIRCTLLPALVCGSAFAQQNPAPTEGAGARKTIVFLGDSLSSGSGVKTQQAFPALVADKIRERGLPFEVVNAGLGGDTTAGGLRRLDWLLQRKVDVLVLELGGNDGLRGLPISNIKSNLQAMIDKAKAKNPEIKIVIAGMQMPPNVGAKYAQEFRQVFYDVAKENDATMIPFLLEGVGGLREFNQPDLIHPNPAGHKIVADVVWKTLEPLLLLQG
jgi:acyl-CoA thioesterase-1